MKGKRKIKRRKRRRRRRGKSSLTGDIKDYARLRGVYYYYYLSTFHPLLLSI